MPTRDNCTALESLLEASTTLVELKKLVDKVEYDIKVLKTRLGNKVGAAAAPGAGALSTEEGGEVLPPAAAQPTDTADAELADGRAQSVVSTRSGRSRKHVRVVRAIALLVCSWMMFALQPRRSGSVSSTDTTATVSTRAGMKRQKRHQT